MGWLMMVKGLPFKHEDPEFVIQHPHKTLGGKPGKCHVLAIPALGRQKQKSSWLDFLKPNWQAPGSNENNLY